MTRSDIYVITGIYTCYTCNKICIVVKTLPKIFMYAKHWWILNSEEQK